MNDEIQMFAPTGDDIKGTLETVQAAARASFHDGGKEFRHTGSSTEFHDSMLTTCIDGVPLFVDSSGDEWLLNHLIPDETPLSACALELLNAEYQIGVPLSRARRCDTATKPLLKWLSKHPATHGS